MQIRVYRGGDKLESEMRLQRVKWPAAVKCTACVKCAKGRVKGAAHSYYKITGVGLPTNILLTAYCLLLTVNSDLSLRDKSEFTLATAAIIC